MKYQPVQLRQSGELNLSLWRGWEPQAGTEGLWSLEKHRLWSLEGTLPGWLCVGESGEQQGVKVGALTNRDCAKFRPKPKRQKGLALGQSCHLGPHPWLPGAWTMKAAGTGWGAEGRARALPPFYQVPLPCCSASFGAEF